MKKNNKEDVVLRRQLSDERLLKIMIKQRQQSNTKFHFHEHVTSTKQSTNYRDQQRFKSKHVQESNIVIDIARTTSSHCSLIEHSLKERVEKYFNREKIHSNTETNLNRLQRITDDVKVLTKQLQQSIQFNNNCSSSIALDERLLGEICYQLERRILTLIFSPTKQFYGYSLRYLPLIIEHESNEQQRTMYKKRFEQIENSLRSVHFQFDYHSNLTFSLINQYGIYFDYQWLNHHAHLLASRSQIHSLCQSIFSKKNYNEDLQIILHSLEIISNSDGKPVFYW